MLDLIQWRARKSPESPALFFNGRWYTYRELEGRANRLAHRLQSLGVQRGDRICVLARNHPVHIDLLLAAPKIGIVCAPLNPELGTAQLVALVAQIKPAMVFADSRQHATAAELGVQWARLSDYREWLAVGNPDAPPVVPLAVDDPLLLFATAQGLAELPYRQVLLNARHAADAWGLSAQDCTVHCLPCHGPEFNLLCLPLLYRGGRVVLMSGFDTDEFLGHLALHRVTVAALTPAMLRRLTQYDDFMEADLSSVDWLASVGGPVSMPVREALTARGLKLRLLTSLAEAGPNLFHTDAGDSASRPELLGHPLPDALLTVQLPDGQPAAPGEAGELCVAGPMVFTGYRGEPPATPPFATGLAVRHGRDGQFSLLGRSRDAFSSGGQSLYPGEVEAALLRCEGVQDCAVFGVPQSSGGHAVAAAVVLQDGLRRDDEALSGELAQMLLSPLRPTHFHYLKMVPRDAWGQPDRLALVQSFIQARAAA
jgi:fatty-acyl-CoA synthase